MRWTQAEYDAHLMRQMASRNRDHNKNIENLQKIVNERDLHERIICHCEFKRWQYLHGAMSRRTFRTVGEPDFIILADAGRVFFVECKSKNGKLSEEQLAFKFHAELNGHKIYIVRSMEEFLEAVK